MDVIARYGCDGAVTARYGCDGDVTARYGCDGAVTARHGCDGAVTARHGCDGDVTARYGCYGDETARHGWANYGKCSGLVHGGRFPSRMKGVVYKSYARPAILYGSEPWCMKEGKIGISQSTERFKVREMCINDRQRAKDLIQTADLNDKTSVKHSKQHKVVGKATF